MKREEKLDELSPLFQKKETQNFVEDFLSIQSSIYNFYDSIYK